MVEYLRFQQQENEVGERRISIGIGIEKNNKVIPSNVENGKIWAIGGGKGGTGKSFVSVNFAIHLASKDKKVVLIDADLGGPNLHTFLGIKETNADLGDFFTNKIKNLEDVAAPTPFKGLELIKGSENVLFMENLNHFKKLKFIRHIKAFNEKQIIVDIGTGTSYNNIDFFILSQQGILVINPEPTSVENAYYFLKSCIIRILKTYINYYKVQDLLQRITCFTTNGSQSIYTFFNEIISYDKSFAQLLFRALKKFKPSLIINKAKNDKDFILGNAMVNVVKNHLAIDLNFLGTVPYDEKVSVSLKKFTPYIIAFPNSEVSHTLEKILEQLTDGKE